MMNCWIEGARPRTLIASLSPVLFGMVVAWDIAVLRLPLFLAILLFALSIQIATNFANDYLDFIHGVDGAERVGPRRVVQSKICSVGSVRRVTLGLFTLVGMIGLYLTCVGGWCVGVLVLLAILLGYFYSGGPCSIGHLGLGDLCVLVLWGPVATAGVTYLQTGALSSIALIAGCIPGFFSTAMIAMNNLRDVDEDRKVGKKSPVVRFGKTFGKWEVALCLIFPCLIPLYLFTMMEGAHPLSLISVGCLVFAIPLVWRLFRGHEPSTLFPKIGVIFMLHTLLFTLGWIIS